MSLLPRGGLLDSTLASMPCWGNWICDFFGRRIPKSTYHPHKFSTKVQSLLTLIQLQAGFYHPTTFMIKGEKKISPEISFCLTWRVVLNLHTMVSWLVFLSWVNDQLNNQRKVGRIVESLWAKKEQLISIHTSLPSGYRGEKLHQSQQSYTLQDLYKICS